MSSSHIGLLKQKKMFCIKIDFNSQRIGLLHQYGCHFFVLEHQYAAVTLSENAHID